MVVRTGVCSVLLVPWQAGLQGPRDPASLDPASYRLRPVGGRALRGYGGKEPQVCIFPASFFGQGPGWDWVCAPWPWRAALFLPALAGLWDPLPSLAF